MRYILSRPVVVELDKPRPLHYTLGAIVDVEDLLQCSLPKLPAWEKLTPKQMRLLLWAGLVELNNLSLEQVGELVSLLTLSDVLSMVGKALVEAYGVPEEGVIETRPGKKKKATERKEVSWRSFWPIAKINYGISTEEFWRLTPRELLALHDRFVWNLENTDFNFATVAQVIANVNRGKNSPALKMKDFMPRRRGKEERQSYQEQLAMAKEITLAFGGKVRADLIEGQVRT